MPPASKAKAKAQRKQPQQPSRPPGLAPKPRAPRPPGGGSALSRYDSRSLGHLPGPRACAPYTVVRERVTFYVQSNTAGQSTVLLIGPYVQGEFGSSGGEHLSSCVAIEGVGGHAPGVTERPITSNLFNGSLAMSKSCSLHSLHADITCTGSASGVLPSGNVWAGAITQPVNRHSGWATFNDLASAFQTRRSMRMFTAYETMTKPISICSYPMDAVAHSEFLWMSGTSSLTDELHRAMTPLTVVMGPTSAVNDYTVSLTIEWRMREALDPLLQSTHKQFVPSSESVWSNLSMHLSNVGGFIKSTSEDPGVQAAIRGAVATGIRYAPRALALMS
jgi:hypothetical protein